MSFVVALVGAESTGKTALAQTIADSFTAGSADGNESNARGRSVALVGEYLREFCDAHGRTPREDEQVAIADEQTRRIRLAKRTHDIVIADTTALMIAVYSEIVFADRSLYASAEAAHRELCDLTLLTALDLPWTADGLQRDGPHVREPVDALVRAALARARVQWSVIHGSGADRGDAALACVQRALSPPEVAGAAPRPRWHWHCERCGDVDCERHALARVKR